MKKVQRIIQNKILTKKSNVANNSGKCIEVPNNVVNKKKVLERYKNAWYSEMNNQYESSDSSGSEIDDDMGYIRMKRNRLRHLKEENFNQSNIIEYSTDQTLTEPEKELGTSLQYISPERDKENDKNSSRKMFMKVALDYLSCDIEKTNQEVTICEGDIIKVIDDSNVKRVTIETINGDKIQIPTCYLADITKEEMAKILNDDKEKENISSSRNDEKINRTQSDSCIEMTESKKYFSSDENSLRSSKRGKKSSKSKKEKTDFDAYLDKRIENMNGNKKSRKNSFSEYWNKKITSLSKYTSLTENLDKETTLEQPDDEALFQYKINPVTQRKMKPKSRVVLDSENEIWIDTKPSEVTTENTSGVTTRNIRENNSENTNEVTTENTSKNISEVTTRNIRENTSENDIEFTSENNSEVITRNISGNTTEKTNEFTTENVIEVNHETKSVNTVEDTSVHENTSESIHGITSESIHENTCESIHENTCESIHENENVHENTCENVREFNDRNNSIVTTIVNDNFENTKNNDTFNNTSQVTSNPLNPTSKNFSKSIVTSMTIRTSKIAYEDLDETASDTDCTFEGSIGNLGDNTSKTTGEKLTSFDKNVLMTNDDKLNCVNINTNNSYKNTCRADIEDGLNSNENGCNSNESRRNSLRDERRSEDEELIAMQYELSIQQENILKQIEELNNLSFEDDDDV